MKPMATRTERLGIIGEKFVNSIFEALIGKTRLRKQWYSIIHQDWSQNYNYGNGVDVKILKQGKKFIGAEVKNWKQQPRTYGEETAREEIISRFVNCTAPIKLLFISFAWLLSQKARELILNSGIEIIEIGSFLDIGKSWFEHKKNSCSITTTS